MANSAAEFGGAEDRMHESDEDEYEVEVEEEEDEEVFEDSKKLEASIARRNEEAKQEYKKNRLEDVKLVSSIPKKSGASQAISTLRPILEHSDILHHEGPSYPKFQVDVIDKDKISSGKGLKDFKMPYLENHADCRNRKHDGSRELLNPHLRTSEKLNVSSAQRRPRSLAHDEPVNNSKKAAIVCSFFAKGWCIKGNSCSFLHQKEVSVKVGEQSKGVVGNPDQIGNLEDHRGKLGEIEASNKSTLHLPLETSNAPRLEKSGLHLHGAPAQSYGKDAYALPKVNNEQINHESDISSEISFKGHLSNYLGYDKRMESFSNEEHERKTGIRCYPDFTSERLSNGPEFASRHYPGEGKSYSEIPKEEIFNGTFFSIPSLPGCKYKSPSPVESAFGLGSTDSYSYRGRPDDLFSKYQKRSYNIDSSLNPLWDSKSDHVSTDITSSVGWKFGHQENSWELSAPFRSSFCARPGIISSSSGRYDPLPGSLLSSKLGTTTSDFSRANTQNCPNMQDDPPLSDNHSPGFSAQKPPSFISQPFGRVLDTTTSPHGYSEHVSVAAGHGSSTKDSRDSYTDGNEKQHVPELTHEVTISNFNISAVLKDLEDREKCNDEPKEGKMFRVALVEYLKELIKPSWNDGLISKDAHKVILKKATEKVIGSIQPLHFPSTRESINQYLSVSHFKLKKLVEGYVSVYKSSQG